jgi:uncharacterized protein with beta-barrel porin domain
MAAYDSGPLGVSAGVAAGLDRHDLARQTYVPELAATAEADGATFGAFVAGSYRLVAGPVHFGPIAALRYVGTRLDGFAEEGAPGLDMQVETQSADALFVAAGLAASAELVAAGAVFRPRAELTLEDELLDDGRSIDTALVTVPGVPRSLAVEPAGGPYGRVAAELAAEFSPRFEAALEGEATLGRAGRDGFSFAGSLTLRF